MTSDSDTEARLKEVLGPFIVHVRDAMVPFVNDALSRTFKAADQMPLVVYSLARKCMKSFSSAIILGRRGYGEDALLVARSMIEATVTAAALEEMPAKADDFVKFYWIYEYRLLRGLRELDPKYAAELFPLERAQEAEVRFHEYRGRYGISEESYFRGTWHRSTILKLIEGLKREEYRPLKDLYTLAYRLGSDVAHGSVIDLMGRVRNEPERLDIDAGPSERFVVQALASAHATLLVMLAVCNNALGLSIEQGISDLNRKHAELWPGNVRDASS